MSALVTIGGMSVTFYQQHGVPVQVQRPAFGAVDAVGYCFPPRTMPVDVPVLQLDPCAGRRLGIEAHLDLAGLSLTGLDGPPRTDVPAEDHSVGWVEGQDPRPPALGPIGCPVHDAAADPRLEHRLG